MNDLDAAAPISPLRQRLIDDMTMRRFSRETQRNYIRDVGRFATFMGRSPGTATAEDLRRFQVEQREAGVPVPTMNGHRVGAAVLLHAHARPSRLTCPRTLIQRRLEPVRLMRVPRFLLHPEGEVPAFIRRLSEPPRQRIRSASSSQATCEDGSRCSPSAKPRSWSWRRPATRTNVCSGIRRVGGR